MQPDVVPSLKYQQEISSVNISRSQFQYATTQQNLGETYRNPRISSGTQKSVLKLPATSQTRPVIIRSLIDTQMPPLTSGEAVKNAVGIETIKATDLAPTEDRQMDLDISEVRNTVKIAESTQTDPLVQVSVEMQTEEFLAITEISEADFPKELQTSVFPQSTSEETCIYLKLSKELGTSVETQTLSLETQTISTETERIAVTSVPVQTKESPEKEFVTASNLERNSEIQKTVIGSEHQPLLPESQEPLLISSSIFEENISTPPYTARLESDTSLEEFTELQISVATQTDCSASFPLSVMSPMRQFQFSIPTVFPSGSLLCRSSPMRTLLTTIGMIFF